MPFFLDALGNIDPSNVFTKEEVEALLTQYSLTEYREDYVVGTTKDDYTGSLTVFDLKDSYLTGNKNLKVYYQGTLMTPGGVDYTETNDKKVTFVSSRTSGMNVSFIWSKNEVS